MPETHLTEFEQARSFIAAWNPSFDGWAIIDKNFKFILVNQQFCDICGVTPAELVGEKFSDITPPHIRALDEKNAKLVMNGAINSYLLPKCYEFQSGHRVEIILLVVGVYDQEGKFLHFLSRIMLNTPQASRTAMGVTMSEEKSSAKSLFLETWTGLRFLKDYWNIITVIAGFVVAVGYAIMNKYYGG